jgi:uncharacterized protein
MHIDPLVALAGFIVGLIVGMTGMGGGALMTPILVLLFKVQPLAAVSSDLVASMIMKPFGSAIHLRRGTVRKELVGWLSLGSLPAAFAGVFVVRLLGNGVELQQRLKVTLGVVLLVAAVAIVAKTHLQGRRPSATGGSLLRLRPALPVKTRRATTVLVGVIGGLVVGMTSVGSGSLIIVALMLLYPLLGGAELVGTDLVQAVPLVTAAAAAHILFGDFKLGITASILVGSIPGVLLGAAFSSRAPDRIVRSALVLVLLASGLKLANVSNAAIALLLIAAGIAMFIYLTITRLPLATASPTRAIGARETDAVEAI